MSATSHHGIRLVASSNQARLRRHLRRTSIQCRVPRRGSLFAVPVVLSPSTTTAACNSAPLEWAAVPRQGQSAATGRVIRSLTGWFMATARTGPIPPRRRRVGQRGMRTALDALQVLEALQSAGYPSPPSARRIIVFVVNRCRRRPPTGTSRKLPREHPLVRRRADRAFSYETIELRDTAALGDVAPEAKSVAFSAAGSRRGRGLRAPTPRSMRSTSFPALKDKADLA